MWVDNLRLLSGGAERTPHKLSSPGPAPSEGGTTRWPEGGCLHQPDKEHTAPAAPVLQWFPASAPMKARCSISSRATRHVFQ